VGDAIEVCVMSRITHQNMECKSVTTVLEEKHARGA
jgi:hypothetical protein